ncbi:MAG: Bug family tripartite tricarboxylate transporter substrate binding protein [Burkholderiales bacterium]
MKFVGKPLFPLLFAGTVLGGASLAAHAQENFPNKFIRFVLPFSAGSGQDILARQISPKLGERLGQPIVVDNKAGAGGLIGFEYIAKAAPDGYQIMMGNNSMLILSAIRPTPYDPLKDFAPIMQLGTGSSMILVHGAVPANNMAEFIAHTKAHPGKLNYSSPAVGTYGHLVTELFKMQTGANMVHIPHKGIVAALNGLIAGDVQFMQGVSEAGLPHVRSGKLKALASAGPRRAPLYPDVPSMGELGFKDYTTVLWYGLFAPTGTRTEIIARLSTELSAIVNEPVMKADLLKRGIEAQTTTGAELGAIMRSELSTWQNVIKVGNIKPE